MGQNPTRDALAKSFFEAFQERRSSVLLRDDIIKPVENENAINNQIKTESGEPVIEVSCDDTYKTGHRKKKRKHSSRSNAPSVRESTAMSPDIGSILSGTDTETAVAVGIPDGADKYELTRDVFDNNLTKLKEVWKKDIVRLNQFVEALDVHETTPVHLAFRMRRKEYLALFFDKVHSSFFERNLSLLDEAINYKDKVYVREMFMHQLEFGSKIASISFDLLARMIYRTNDFYSTFNWNVKTWVPLVSKLLPHDTTIIYKYGQCVRIDTRYRVLGVKIPKVNGHTSILYNPEVFDDKMVVIDRVKNLYMYLTKASFEKHGAPTEKWLKKEVEAIMKKGELSAELDWKSIQFKPENKKGKQKEKVIGGYPADRYKWSNVRLSVKTRKTYINDLSNFNGNFDDYMAGQLPEQPVEQPIVKESEKEFRGRIAFSKTFPLDFPELLSLIDVEAPMIRKIFTELAEYDKNADKLPEGFPVFLELPVAPGAKFYLRITDYARECPAYVAQDENFFVIPKDARRSYQFDWY